MSLALYDPARFDRSPASIFSISNPTADADVRLSTIRIENQVSVLDLRGAMRKKSERHRACFAAVLDRCYSRIRRCASVLRDECTFEVPLFLPGFPVYDVERCVRFVASHLAKNGFRVERMPDESDEGGRVLVISWSTHDPNDDPPPPPLAYRPVPKIQEAFELRAPPNAIRDREERVPPRPPRPPQPFGSAFAPLIPPERLLRPVSDFSPPPLGTIGTLPLAVGTRMSSPIKSSDVQGVQGVQGVQNVRMDRNEGRSDPRPAERRRPAKPISEFRPNSKFAL